PLHIISLRPRSSALFPYTTLFRSCFPWKDAHRGKQVRGSQGSAQGAKGQTAPGDDQLLRRRPRFSGLTEAPLRLHKDGVRRTGKDRKSTRLNSSHGSISYAVFCLK